MQREKTLSEQKEFMMEGGRIWAKMGLCLRATRLQWPGKVGAGEARALTKFFIEFRSISKDWTVRLSSVSVISAAPISAVCEVTTVVLSSICRGGMILRSLLLCLPASHPTPWASVLSRHPSPFPSCTCWDQYLSSSSLFFRASSSYRTRMSAMILLRS